MGDRKKVGGFGKTIRKYGKQDKKKHHSLILNGDDFVVDF